MAVTGESVEDLRREAIRLVESAFAQATFRRAMGFHEAAVFDDHYWDSPELEHDLNEARDADRAFAELHWTELPREAVLFGANWVGYLDDESFCALLPALLVQYMTEPLAGGVDGDPASWDSFESMLLRRSIVQMLDAPQRCAVLAFLRFDAAWCRSLCESYEEDNFDVDVKGFIRLLEEIERDG